MARAKLSAKQEEIKDLIAAKPDITADEIAKEMETSPGAIHQQMTRMRSIGALPKTRRRGKNTRRRARIAASASPAPERAAKPSDNGAVSLEDHLTSELDGTVGRLGEVERLQTELALEAAELDERRKRLHAAQEALSTAPAA